MHLAHPDAYMQPPTRSNKTISALPSLSYLEGMYDGTLGVIGAIEAIRALQQAVGEQLGGRTRVG